MNQLQGLEGRDYGWLTVETGNMFGGKSESLIRQMERADRANLIRGKKHPLYLPVKAYKHAIDNRYAADSLSTHNSGDANKTFPCLPCNTVDQLVEDVELHDIRVIGIDEVQFFLETDHHGVYKIVLAIEKFINDKRSVIVAGLNRDFKRQPFGPMPYLLSMAHNVNHHHSLCSVCGLEATETQRLVNGKPAYFDDPVILVGASDDYEPRCVLDHKIAHRKIRMKTER